MTREQDFSKYNNTLFIDRDGVINVEKANDYILSWQDFMFYDGVLDAFKIFANHFKNIIVITNQRCVGKGLLSPKGLENIHLNMINTIEQNSGRIDKIYYCADIADDAECRKPNIGMALQAKKDFKNIDFKNSVMVGNKKSDMEFGNKIGVKNVLITSTNPELISLQIVDAHFDNLQQFSKHFN